MWQLKNAATVIDKSLYIFPAHPAYRMSGSRNEQVKNAGMNPYMGVVVNYWVKNYIEGDTLTIVVKDRDKKTIRMFTNFPVTEPVKPETGKLDVSKGMNVFVWDMLYPPAEKVEGMILWSGNVPGPKAAPGNYFVEIKAGKKDSIETTIVIKANPVYQLTQQDYEAQFAFLLSVRDQFSEVQKAIKNIRDLRKQLTDFTDRQGKACPKEIKDLADTINKQITAVEEALYQTKAKSAQDVLNYPIRLNDKIAGLYDYAASGNYAPTKQVKDAYADLSAQAETALNKLKKIINTDVVKLNQVIRDKALPLIGIKQE